ncbi:MAG TPA: N-acetylmuramoyl-L-alanine amidase [Thermoanaerobaculia bacterium]|nr:N-acetylmuramoyl-L-alanine amidase [Thermoanaerobaculia bacterium]
MKSRPRSASPPLVLLLLVPVLLIAQSQQPAPVAGAPGVVLDGREIAVRVTILPAGPLFALAALTPSLGGDLVPGESAESFILKLADKEIVMGIGSAVVTVGDAIVSLSQPPTRGEGGVQVPLDFLNKTYGELSGFSFDWRPEQQRLVISRRKSKEIAVTSDIVHLQGMTTVVLQFPEVPHYHLNQQPGAVEVQMLADRLAPAPQRRIEDPLVKAIEISPEKVRIDLVPQAQVESYILENPFRLVFDIHEAAAAAQPSGPAFAPPEPSGGVRTIVIDPGHGGTETGAIGPGGVQEKQLTLILAQTLASRLSQQLAVRTVLTRSEDANLPLDTRAAIANQNKADLFVSIHLNSSLGAGAHGAETYFLSAEATDVRAANAAKSENGEPAPASAAANDAAAGEGDLQLILWDLAQTHHLSASQRLANLVQGELNQTLQLKDRGVKQAPFRVLMGATMPAVLVELGFISNPEEEKKLQDPEYRAALVEALVKAISVYKEMVETPAAAAPAGQPAPPAPRPAPAPQPPAGAPSP